jgi:hypothetical protein
MHPVARGTKIKDVHYVININDDEEYEAQQKNGKLQFVVQSNDEKVSILIEKPGFITKEILMMPGGYPFEFDYEIQHLDIEMVPVSEELPVSYAGELKYDILNGGFHMVKQGADAEALKKQLAESETKLQEVYELAIKNADGLAAIEEYEYAKYFYDLALTIGPEESYPAKRTSEMDVLAAEKREQDALLAQQMPEGGVPQEQVEAMAREMAEQMLAEQIASGQVQVPSGGSQVYNTATTPSGGYNQASSQGMEATDFSGGNMDGVYYSVQIGAFKGNINESTFSAVPGYRVIVDTDWKRAFSGEFSNRSEARARLSQMQSMGFGDAFLVKLKGNRRISF